MKARLVGGLLLVGLAGVFATSVFGAESGHTQKSATVKVGVSLAGYSTDFWSSYVAFEKAAGKKYGVSLVGPISANGDVRRRVHPRTRPAEQIVEISGRGEGKERTDCLASARGIDHEHGLRIFGRDRRDVHRDDGAHVRIIAQDGNDVR